MQTVPIFTVSGEQRSKTLLGSTVAGNFFFLLSRRMPNFFGCRLGPGRRLAASETTAPESSRAASEKARAAQAAIAVRRLFEVIVDSFGRGLQGRVRLLSALAGHKTNAMKGRGWQRGREGGAFGAWRRGGLAPRRRRGRRAGRRRAGRAAR